MILEGQKNKTKVRINRNKTYKADKTYKTKSRFIILNGGWV